MFYLHIFYVKITCKISVLEIEAYPHKQTIKSEYIIRMLSDISQGRQKAVASGFFQGSQDSLSKPLDLIVKSNVVTQEKHLRVPWPAISSPSVLLCAYKSPHIVGDSSSYNFP